ncbi:helix-turn-helix domain-containing protein [Rubrivivax gelatinosus]|uniref:helix-turn-helix domain-containing protein n=1 Tax=Rubrivivax gelatinosus TaxID=28068 RepID=UPI0002FACEF8|nr:helix-turn-helix domain-containing protein [Rubrivivax gelatinosus]
MAEAFFSGPYAPVKVLVPGRRLHLDITSALGAGLGLYRTRSSTGLRFQTDSLFDGYNVAVATSGRHSLISGGRERQARADAGLVSDGAVVESVDLGPDLNLQGLSITSDVLHQCLAELIDAPVLARVRFQPVLEPGSTTMRTLLLLCEAMSTGLSGDAPLQQSPAALSSLRSTIAHLVLTGIPNSYSDQIAGRLPRQLSPAHVRRAMDYMQANASQPLTIADVALAAGASARSLQTAFRQFRGCTPSEYLRQIRLERVRADLLDGSQPRSVSRIAMHWGFAHMGQFAERYRSAYGEAPSATLARRGR